MQVPFLDLKAQYDGIKDEIAEAVDKVFDSRMFCLGPSVVKFEQEIASYCGSKFAVGVSSGSDALVASLMALGIGSGDEVITTPFTFFATAASIVRVGATPVFVDIDEDTYNISAAGIEAKITGRTRAILPVHLYGQVAQMGPISEIAQRHGLAIVEDACQSIGAGQDGVMCGNFGAAGCFSFYPTKNLGAAGDAGLVTTNDEEVAERLRIVRDHGQNPRYFYKMIGGNFRLDGIQAAVLSAKLKHLDRWNQRRRDNAALYDELLSPLPLRCPKTSAGNVCVYHQYTIAVADRDRLKDYLAEKGISSAVFYPKPLHVQGCFADLGYNAGDFPATERACEQVLSLPIYSELRQEQIRYVASTIREFYESSTSAAVAQSTARASQD